MKSPATSRPGLIPVLALLLVGLNLRPVLAVVSLLTDSIRASNGMSFEQIGWLTSLPMMAMGLIAMAGGLVYRLGYRRGVAIGLALTAASALAKLASHEPLWLMGSSVAAGLGIGIVQSLIPGYIKTRFPHRVDLLMGLYVSMIMGGAALAAASASALLQWLDWQGTMAFWAVLAIAGIALWLPNSGHADAPAASASATAGKPAAFRPWQHGRTWLLVALFCVSSSCYTLCLAWIAPYMMEAGVRANEAGFMLAALSLSEVAGGFLVSWLAPRFRDRRVLLALFLAATALTYVLIGVAPMYAPWLMMCLLGLSIGGLFPMTLILVMDHCSQPAKAGILVSFVQGVGYLVGGVLPFVAGSIRDTVGDLSVAWVAMACVTAAALVLAARATPASAERFDAR